MSILQKYGIPILSEECKTISVHGEMINLCGVDDPEAFAREADPRSSFAARLENVSAASDNGHYTILLSHRPEYFDVYSECGFDLVLCGHAHGGQWRLPWLLNGVFAPDQGLFPEYAGGQYAQADTTMIVSRGPARESTRIPRIFNRPELVLIEIK
jgi:predicted MPP superfamily phosphohydrolase